MADRDIAILCGLSRFDSDILLEDDSSLDVAVYFDHKQWSTVIASMYLNVAFEEVEKILVEAGFQISRIVTGPWFTKSKIISATVEQVQQALEEAQGIRIVIGQTQ